MNLSLSRRNSMRLGLGMYELIGRITYV